MPEALAKEDREYLWQFDERGSFNAVCGFLRRLGVRWYLPGELDEVVPKMKSIPLPRRSFNGKPKATAVGRALLPVETPTVTGKSARPTENSDASGSPLNEFLFDETVKPDFEVRQFSVRFATADDEVMRWAMRVGIRQVSTHAQGKRCDLENPHFG